MILSTSSNIWLHSSLEAVLSEQLSNRNHEVTIVRCQGLLNNYCTAMAEAKLDQDASLKKRKEICKKCTSRSDGIDMEYRFNSIYVDNFIDLSDKINIENTISDITPKNWKNLEFLEIPVGRYAAYEFVLTNKINSFFFDSQIFNFYLDQLKNTLLSLLSFNKILKTYKPDVIIFQNELYSTNRVVSKLAKNMQIETLHLTIGTDLEKFGSSYSIYRNPQVELEINSSQEWLAWSKIPLGKNEISQVFKGIMYKVKARSAFTYSSKTTGKNEIETYEFFNLDKDLPVCLALTSSFDERFAADLVDIAPYKIYERDSQIFKNQWQWVANLIELFQERPDMQLIIRIHPRFFPNKRDNKFSPNLIYFQELSKTLPKNVVINWPGQSISIYEVAQVTDVCLNATSSAGLEMLNLGIPVICHDIENLFAYPQEFNKKPLDINEYLSHIDNSIKEGWSLTNVVNATRWNSFRFHKLARSLEISIPLRSKWSFLRILNGIDFALGTGSFEFNYLM